jgi:hypothetical protein
MNGENVLSGGFDREQHWEEDESVLEAAAHAVRAVVSITHDIQTIAWDTGAIQVIDTMLAALITTSSTTATSTAAATTSGHKQRDAAERKASQHLLVALVHVLYHTDQNKALNALHVLRNRALGPLLSVANEASNSTSSSSYFNLVKLSAFLEDSMAFLNALESHRDHLDLRLDQYGAPSSSTAVDIAVSDAVGTCLAVWPTILTALSQAPTTTTATIFLCSTIYQDASQCLCSCIVLAPTSITPSLKPLLESTFSSFFLPGGHILHRILCELFRMTTNEEVRLDVSSLTAKYEQITTLVAALGKLLMLPQAQKFYSLGGGDSDPDAVCALLTIATCFLREVSSTQWNATLTNIRSQASAGGGGGDEAVVSPFVECVDLSLRLAAANTACNHRGVCHSAISTLLAASKLFLDTSCNALRTPLLQYISQVQSYRTTSSTINGTIGNTNGLDTTSNNSGGGGVMMQGIMLCMLSLHASSFLQKNLTLLTNAAELAKTCSEASLLSQQMQSVHTTNYGEETNVEVQCVWICLQEWWNTARTLLLNFFPERAEGVAGESTGAAEILNSLNLRDLAAAVSGGNTPTEARRGIQRAVRPLTDQIRRRNHHVGSEVCF